MACVDCRYAVKSPEIMRFYCMNRERNKNTARKERYKRTQGINCPYFEKKEVTNNAIPYNSEVEE